METDVRGLVDTHIHLEDPAFAEDRQAVLARARECGVAAMVNAGSTVEANRAAWDILAPEPDIYFGMGLHPHEFPGTPIDALNEMREQLTRERVVAVGEIGLDYHLFPGYPPPDREAQQDAFACQLDIARMFELPVILHVREAFEDAFRLLQAHGPFCNGGVMHCYSGGAEYLDRVLEMGLHIGIGGPVTYPKAQDVREAVRRVPMERLLLETDGPYLPPQSMRGKRNESSYLPEVVQKIADVRGMTPAAVVEKTGDNARRLFKLGRGRGQWTYEIKGHLYVNLTNRCSADCVFCPRKKDRTVQGFDLTLDREPDADALIVAIGDPTQYSEVVFCGFGEPLLRLTTLLKVAKAVKAKGGRTRVDTNGHADVLFNQDVLPGCKGVIDAWSVSINSADEAQYRTWVRPAAGKQAFFAVQAFIKRAVESGFDVTATAVEMEGLNVAEVRRLCSRWGVRYRGRTFQRLGEPEDVPSDKG